MAKTIFRSTEKSNFILNLTEEKYTKMASVGLLTALFLVSVITIIPECTDKATYSVVAGGLALSGVICLMLALIALIKKYIRGKTVFPVCAFGAMVVWGIVSLINSYDVQISLYGYPERGEGLLAILFYFGFFVTAASIKRKKALKTLLFGVIGTGLLNSVWGIIQVFTGKLSHYRLVSLEDTAHAASGLSQSPLFLAMVLSLSLTAAIVGAISSDNKKIRIFCIISIIVFSFTMMFTYSFIGICGLVFSVIAAIIAVIITKAPKIRLLSIAAVVIPAILSVLIVNLGAVGNISSYRLYDGTELWWADSYMRVSASGDYNREILDINNTADVYLYLNSKTINIIEKNPLTGTGPEQLVFPQIYTMAGLSADAEISDVVIRNIGTFDKVYNEYLYTAATRGIPSLIALLAVIIPVLLMSLSSMKKQRSGDSAALFLITLCGALIFLIGCSNITFSPIFWAIAGASVASASQGDRKTKRR